VNTNQVLLPIYRTLRPIVDRCRLNALARPVWAALWRKQSTRLVHAEQNDRMWWLDPEVALRGSRDLLRKNRPTLAAGFHPFAFKQPDVAQAEIIALCGEAGLRLKDQGSKPWGLGEYFAST
jgi:hypothetical protein